MHGASELHQTASGSKAVLDVQLRDLAVGVTVVGVDPLIQVADRDDTHALQLLEGALAVGGGEALGAAPALLAIGSEEGKCASVLAAADELHEERLAKGGVAGGADTAAPLAPVMGRDHRADAVAQRTGRDARIRLDEGDGVRSAPRPEGAGGGIHEDATRGSGPGLGRRHGEMGGALIAATAASYDGEVRPRPAHSAVSIAAADALWHETAPCGYDPRSWRAHASCWPRTR